MFVGLYGFSCPHLQNDALRNEAGHEGTFFRQFSERGFKIL